MGNPTVAKSMSSTSLRKKSSADEREDHAHHQRIGPVQRRCQEASGCVAFLRVGSDRGRSTRQGVWAFRPAARFLDEAHRVVHEFAVVQAAFAAGGQTTGHGRRRRAGVVHVDVVSLQARFPLIFLLDGGHVHALAAGAVLLRPPRTRSPGKERGIKRMADRSSGKVA